MSCGGVRVCVCVCEKEREREREREEGKRWKGEKGDVNLKLIYSYSLSVVITKYVSSLACILQPKLCRRS